jgi:hypothetical protein
MKEIFLRSHLSLITFHHKKVPLDKRDKFFETIHQLVVAFNGIGLDGLLKNNWTAIFQWFGYRFS